MQGNPYFSLIVPVCGILLGAALLGCWAALQRRRYFLWLAAAYILPALPLAAQSMMTNQQLAATSTVLGAFYLAGLWALAQGMAEKYGGTAHPRMALAIGLATLALLYHFSQVTDQLRVRMLVLNVAMLLLLLLGMAAVLRSGRPADRLERVLRGSYLVFVAYCLARPVIIFAFVWAEPLPELTRSPWWLLMLATNLLLSLWFIGVLLTVSVREMLFVVQNERDRDPLTQLLNRRAFFELAPARIRRSGLGAWALLVCDVDHFKQINDTLGHAAGDAVLQAVARVLERNVRQDDLVVRFGGEEFIVLLQCTDLAAASAVANRMREQLAQMPHPALGRPLTACFGVAPVEGAQGIQAAIDRADALLYQAKKTGRNKVVSGRTAAPSHAPAAQGLPA
ncbi:MAG TPA: GGDEF domain-containing protein [Pseudorhodoferax sp.]|nr:GGDEF domain-containing protein [Pseudorhodoferax sp.]